MFRILLALTPFLSLALVGCFSKPVDIRVPASTSVYNSEKVELLKKAADAGILFQISDSALRDVPSRQVTERCRKVDEAMWSEKFYETMRLITSKPQYSKKLHVIEFKRGDSAKVEISKDLDGVTYFQLAYGKVETRESVKRADDLPCADRPVDLVGKDLVTVEYNWPTREQQLEALDKAPDKPDSDRFKFDHTFIRFLAEKQTVFRLNSDIAFEKSAAGHNLLRAFMTKMSQDIKENSPHDDFDFWSHELSVKSKQSTNLKFFTLKRDIGLAHGIQVDSGGKFARKINGFSEPTYFYMSYRAENGAFFLPSLKELNQCLHELSSIAGTADYKNTFDMDPDSFLYPGHHCQVSETSLTNRSPASDPQVLPAPVAPTAAQPATAPKAVDLEPTTPAAPVATVTAPATPVPTEATVMTPAAPTSEVTAAGATNAAAPAPTASPTAAPSALPTPAPSAQPGPASVDQPVMAIQPAAVPLNSTDSVQAESVKVAPAEPPPTIDFAQPERK